LNSAVISTIVAQALDAYVYEAPAQGSTLGVPWTEEKVRRHLSLLRAALVVPYLQKFELRDTFAQMRRLEAEIVEYWVVAVTAECVEFYDPTSEQFGLAANGPTNGSLGTIGVRGDLVGVFCAM